MFAVQFASGIGYAEFVEAYNGQPTGTVTSDVREAAQFDTQAKAEAFASKARAYWNVRAAIQVVAV